MKQLKLNIANYFLPGLILAQIVKSLFFGFSFAESVALTSVCAVYGLHLFYHLKRIDTLDKRRITKLEKDIKDLTSHVSMLKIQSARTQGVNIPMGNVPWQKS